MKIIAMCIMIFLIFGCLGESGKNNPTGNYSNNSSIGIVGNTTNQNITGLPPVTNNMSKETVPVVQNTSSVVNNTTNNSGMANQTTGTVNATKTDDRGLWFGNGSYQIVLNDVATYSTEDNCGMFTIKDKKGNELTKAIICEGNERAWISPEGRAYRIKVYTTAAGYSKQNTWASIIIYG